MLVHACNENLPFYIIINYLARLRAWAMHIELDNNFHTSSNKERYRSIEKLVMILFAIIVYCNTACV